MPRVGARLLDLPADLQFVLAWVAVLVAIQFLPGHVGVALGIVVGLPFVLVAPGYAVVALLFPQNPNRSDGVATTRSSGVSSIERLVLSVAVSVAAILLVGTALALTPFGFRATSVTAVLTSFTGVMILLAARRRLALPADERFRVSTDRWRPAVPAIDAHLVVNVALVASLAVGTAVVAHDATSRESRGFTEVGVLSTNKSGALAADEYPAAVVRGQSTPMRLAVENHEGRPVEYTVLVRVQQRRPTSDGGGVVRQRWVTRVSATVAPGERWMVEHAVSPRLPGDRLLLQYLVYRGAPPSNPTAANAYREVHLWLNVTR